MLRVFEFFNGRFNLKSDEIPVGDELMNEDIKAKIRTVPDWPKKGIMFREKS